MTPSSPPSDGYDPDTPLPSVERNMSLASSRESASSRASNTPSSTPRPASTLPASDQNDVLQQLGSLRSLRLDSSQTTQSPSSVRETRAPSIHVTPSASPDPPTRKTDGLIDGITALRIDSHQSDASDASRLRESRSPTPSRRRRSGSKVIRDIYKIEDEEPPKALFHKPEVQKALVTARSLTSRMVNVLSGSNLHRESGSSIENLHKQATKLNEFQLPSSRIVGLVGDSGVGKSSLINSLLDKAELARAVCEH